VQSIVAQNGNDVVRLRDIADVTVGAEDERSAARWNGEPAIGLVLSSSQKPARLMLPPKFVPLYPK